MMMSSTFFTLRASKWVDTEDIRQNMHLLLRGATELYAASAHSRMPVPTLPSPGRASIPLSLTPTSRPESDQWSRSWASPGALGILCPRQPTLFGEVAV